MRRLVLYRGVPGSGKSTQAVLDAAEDTCILEEDDYFTLPDGTYRFSLAHRQAAVEWVLANACALLYRGAREVFVCAVLPLKADVAQFKKIVLDRHPDVSFEVREPRQGTGSIHGVPTETQRMFESLYEPYQP